MTTADKTDILNLVKNADALAKTAEDANAPYYDSKIVDFAKAAIDDAASVNDFVKGVVQKNILHFIDPNCIRIGGGCFGYQDISLFNKKGEIKICLGNYLYAVIGVGYWEQRMDKPHTFDEVYISALKNGITVKRVYTYTSDTFLKLEDWEYKNESIYNVCSQDDLFFKPQVYFSSSDKHTPKEWKTIYGKATWTRAKAAFLIYCLKKALTARVNGLREFANERELTRENNEKIQAYKKVSL